MKKPTKKMFDPAFPLATAIGIPVVIIALWLALRNQLPMQALAVMVGAYVMGLVWAFMSIIQRGREARARHLAVASPEGVPGLELIDSVPVPPMPRTVTVIGAVGVCPRGLKIGDRLDVNTEGRSSSPLCRAAVDALRPLLIDDYTGYDPEAQVRCVCPLVGRHLTFVVSPASAASVD
jgi:uncharacterized repeat protein (TIGR04076 family)